VDTHFGEMVDTHSLKRENLDLALDLDFNLTIVDTHNLCGSNLWTPILSGREN